jgi:RNA polymerase sigma factor (sigma-70 family)
MSVELRLHRSGPHASTEHASLIRHRQREDRQRWVVRCPVRSATTLRHPVERSDAELLQGIRGDDHSAWNEFVRRHTQRIWNAARAQVQEDHLAADVVQTVWVELIRHLDSIRNDASIRYWLVTVAHHEAIRVSKQQRRFAGDAPLSFLADPGSPDEARRIEESDQVAALRRAFDELSDNCRALLGLLFSGRELTYDEIAEQLRRPVGSIGPTRERCLTRLKKRFDLVAG